MSSVSSFAIDWLNEHCQTTPAIALQRIQRQRETERESNIVLLGERICVDVTHEFSEARTWRQLCFVFFVFAFLALPHSRVWVTWGVLYLRPLVNTLTLCDAHVYTALHIYTHAHTCARTMLPSQQRDFTVWRNLKKFQASVEGGCKSWMDLIVFDVVIPFVDDAKYHAIFILF